MERRESQNPRKENDSIFFQKFGKKKFYRFFFPSASTTAASTSASRHSDPKLAATFPSLPTTYLKKFHVGTDPEREEEEVVEEEEDDDEEEEEEGLEEVRNLKTGCESAPATESTLLAIRKYSDASSGPPLTLASSAAISKGPPGSCPPKALQGKPSTVSPRGPNFFARADKPRRLVLVKPQWEAELNTKTTRPRREDRSMAAASGLFSGAGSRAGTGGRSKKEATATGRGGGGGGGGEGGGGGRGFAVAAADSVTAAAAGGGLPRCERA